MLAVFLALGASVCWGASDFLGGIQARRLPLLAVLAVSLPAGLLVIGTAVAVRAEAPPDAVGSLYAALGGLSGVVGLAALYRGLAVGAMGIVAPITATAPVVPVAVGLARGERLSALQAIGIALALAGVAVASRQPVAEERSAWVAAGAGLAVVAALAFGSSMVALDAASGRDPYWATLIVRLVGIAVVGVLVARTPAALRAARPALVTIGVLDTSATTMFAVATTKGLVSVVSVLASLFPIVVVLLARLVLHERLRWTQRGGAAAALGGAALISAG